MLKHAKSELDKINNGNIDEFDNFINDCVLEIVEVFSKQGHSGFSGMFVLGILDRVLKHKPLTPLTGDDEEWVDVGESGGKSMQQNIRYPSAFRYNNDNSTAYDSQAIIFSDDGGETWYTKGDKSSRDITFPYEVPDEPHKIVKQKVRQNGF